jgi:hypothetical protein
MLFGGRKSAPRGRHNCYSPGQLVMPWYKSQFPAAPSVPRPSQIRGALALSTCGVIYYVRWADICSMKTSGRRTGIALG